MSMLDERIFTGWVGATAEAGVLATAEANVGKIPDVLGRGYLTTAGDLRGLIVVPNEAPNKAERESHRDSWSDFKFVDDRSSFASYVTFSAHAKFSFSGGSGSARAAMSRSYRRSMRTLHLVVVKEVKIEKIFLRDPHVRLEAVAEFKKDRDAFVRKYGDAFVRAVYTGGLLSMIYQLDFETTEEKNEFQVSAQGQYGNAKGGASLHTKLLKSATHASLSLQAIASGVDHAPPVFVGSQGVDKTTGKIKANDTLADALIAYFDTFEEHVSREHPVVVDMERVDTGTAVNMPPGSADLSSTREVINAGSALDNIIDERVSEIEYMRDVAHRWNPQVHLDSLSERREKLLRMSDVLEGELAKLATLDNRKLTLPFQKRDIQAIPDNWILRKLVEVGRATGGARETSDEVPLRVPLGFEGQPIRVIVEASYAGNRYVAGAEATVEVFWESDDGKREPVLDEPLKFTRGGNQNNLKKPAEVIVPSRRDFRMLKALLVARRGATVVVTMRIEM
jgi:hypothetical protein